MTILGSSLRTIYAAAVTAASEFQRDGAVALRGVLSASEVDALRAGVERNLAEPGDLAIRTGRFFEDFRNWERIAEYESVIRGSRLAAIAGDLMAASAVRLFHDHLLVKEAGSTEPSPWHQDQPYYCVDGAQNVSFWIPLDPVTRENTLEFAAGSHASGTWYMPRSFVAKTPMVFEEGALAEVPEIDPGDVVGWALEPGDAVAFHMLTLHQAAGSPTRRRAFSVRLLGDDATYAPRPHRTSPPFGELDLPDGAPLDHPLFPVLWTR
jgi:ectoine hydroxylase-related dioxygenase (phytanoyl-CoA dioxygenase family)